MSHVVDVYVKDGEEAWVQVLTDTPAGALALSRLGIGLEATHKHGGVLLGWVPRQSMGKVRTALQRIPGLIVEDLNADPSGLASSYDHE